MQEYTFKVPEECGHTVNSLDCLSYNYRSLRMFKSYTIDMSDLTFIHPVAVVGLMCLLERISTLGTLNIMLPRDPAVCQYFGEVDLISAMNQLYSVNGDPKLIESISPKITPIVPLTSFHSDTEVEEIASHIETTFMDNYNISSLLQPCYTIITELAGNVIQHSEKAKGWVLVQKYEKPSGSIIEIAVGDAGIGIRRSLKKNDKLIKQSRSDAAALKAAVGENVSRFKDPYRGFGLHHIIDEVKSPDRRLTLRSGIGVLTINENGIIKVSQKAKKPLVGVLAEAHIPC